MRIAMLCRRYHPQIGGIETHVKEIAERLSNSHEVVVYTLVKDRQLVGDEMINGVRVKRFKSFGLDYSAEIPPRSLLREIEEFDPHIVHSHSVHTSLPYFASKIRCNRAKFVVTPHYQGKATNAFRQILFVLYKPLLGSALSKADRIVCVSSAERDMLSSIFKIDQQKVRIVQNGVGSDLSNITSLRKRQDNGELRILSVARFDLQHKKTDKLIKAFKLLESKINAILVLVGNGPDRQEIINLVKSLNLDDKVEIKTNLSREDLVREYAKASIFVTASEKEAFGIAVAEALAAKLKVIVPNATALSSYVKAGYALGVEVPVTPEKLAEAVLSGIQNDWITPTTVEYSPYTWDIAARDQEAVYEELLSEDQK
jgi:glycosyltransferase involved in cell wall biosynthesis